MAPPPQRFAGGTQKLLTPSSVSCLPVEPRRGRTNISFQHLTPKGGLVHPGGCRRSGSSVLYTMYSASLSGQQFFRLLTLPNFERYWVDFCHTRAKTWPNLGVELGQFRATLDRTRAAVALDPEAHCSPPPGQAWSNLACFGPPLAEVGPQLLSIARHCWPLPGQVWSSLAGLGPPVGEFGPHLLDSEPRLAAYARLESNSGRNVLPPSLSTRVQLGGAGPLSLFSLSSSAFTAFPTFLLEA